MSCVRVFISKRVPNEGAIGVMKFTVGRLLGKASKCFRKNPAQMNDLQ